MEAKPMISVVINIAGMLITTAAVTF
jgi:hypothetical protein